MVQLPPKDDDEGCETRLLLAECVSPSFSSYSAADAQTCMQYMDLVLWNRYYNSKRFAMKKAPQSIADVIRAPGQFAGFGNYPNYSLAIVRRIQSMVDIANAKKDKRSSAFEAHVNLAMTIAASPFITEPSSGMLAGWRVHGSGSPGGGFTFFKTVLGNDFYYV